MALINKINYLLNKNIKSFFDYLGGNKLISKHSRIINRTNITIGYNTRIGDYATIWADGQSIEIGQNCIIHEFSYLRLCGGWVSIGNNCSVNPFTVIYGHGGLRVGNNVRIACHVTIIPSNHNFQNRDSLICKQGETSLGITIEDDVWIATGVKILDGVTIAKGCVIGAGAILTKSTLPYGVYVGVPAKLIKFRGMDNEQSTQIYSQYQSE